MSVPRIRLQVLGTARVTSSADDQCANALSQPLRVALLAYLTLARPRGLHARDKLLALFWPDSDQHAGRQALRNALHGIRKALGADVLITEGDSLVGVDLRAISCDLIDLENVVSEGYSTDTVAEHHGQTLHGFHIRSAPDFEKWLDAERSRVDDLILGALWALSQQRHQAGDADGALRAARRASALSPYDERALRRLVQLLDAAGDIAGVLLAFDQFAARLQSEMGFPPTADTIKIVREIRSRRDIADASRTRSRQSAGQAPPTSSSAAYIQYVRGTYLFLRAAHGGSATDLEESRQLFEDALADDPQFGLAYAGLSNYFAVAAARNILRPFHDTFSRALQYAERAQELNPQVAIPYVHRGVKAMYLDGDWERAGEEFRRAVEVDPLYAEARRFLGIWLDVIGYSEEGLDELRATVRQEPHIPMFRNTLAAAYMDRHLWTDAVRELKRALAIDPSYAAARGRLINCLEQLGQYHEAVTERCRATALAGAERFRSAFDSSGSVGYLKVAHEDMRAQLHAVEARAVAMPSDNAADIFRPPALIAADLHMRMGNHAGAQVWRERACATRPGLAPWFDALARR